MKTLLENKNLPIAVVLAGAMIAFAIVYNKVPDKINLEKGEDIGKIELREDDHILGDKNAPIKIVEYSDTECPFCKMFHQTMKEVAKNYVETGKVAWVYRHFPLSIHPKANKEAEALECAAELGGENAFWSYLDILFSTTPGNDQLDPKMLPEIAKVIKLDEAKFSSCLASGKYKSKVDKDFVSGLQAKVEGTPHSIIITPTGDQIVVNGAERFNSIKVILDAVLSGK